MFNLERTSTISRVLGALVTSIAIVLLKTCAFKENTTLDWSVFYFLSIIVILFYLSRYFKIKVSVNPNQTQSDISLAVMAKRVQSEEEFGKLYPTEFTHNRGDFSGKHTDAEAWSENPSLNLPLPLVLPLYDREKYMNNMDNGHGDDGDTPDARRSSNRTSAEDYGQEGDTPDFVLGHS